MTYRKRYLLRITILLAALLVSRSAMAQVHVHGNVFGGGKSAEVGGAVTVNMNGGTVEKDVYGGGALADTNTSSDDYIEEKVVVGETDVTGLFTQSGSDYVPAVSGPAASGTTYYRKVITTVNLLGGLIQGDAYGGGLGQKEGFNGAASGIAAVVRHDIFVTLNGTAFDINYDDTSDILTDKNGNPVLDPENENEPKHVQVVKSGRVFGCNNLNGSPEGNVTVTVYKTVEGNTPRTAADKKDSPTESDHKYELAAVYGGGNLAPYTTNGKQANVIIYGCDDTSILTVYGGGNAAAVPRTHVEIRSCYEIGSVFGGGNGKDKYTTDGGTTWVTNPGANVNGEAYTRIYGGTVHEAYGASNEKGTIYGNVDIDLVYVASNDPEYCELDVGKLVGAGKNADVEGNLIVVMGCKPNGKVPLVYAGADNANVKGNVELTITSGNFGKVFGGNNEGGAILGHIKLNIEETGTCATPITIDELYLGGNEAAYSRYGYYVQTKYTANNNDGTGDPDDDTQEAVLTDGKLTFKPRVSEDDTHLPVKGYDRTANTWTVYHGDEDEEDDVFTPYAQPVLNIISCTRIGAVFGGGLGETAIMCADPTVNINMEPGALAAQIDRDGIAGPDDTTGKLLGEIGGKYTNDKDQLVDGGVYGGGNAAAVYGTTTVNIGTETEVQMTSIKDNEGNLLASQPKHTVTGAYIVGNVYGGGKLADVGKYHEVADPNVAGRNNVVIEVTGNTNVNIGVKYNTNNAKWESVPEGTAGVFIGGDVYGGGMGDDTSFFCDAAMVLGNEGTTESSNDTNNDGGGTHVRIGNGTINGNVYGGGEIARVERNTEVTIGFGEGVAGTPTTNKPVIEGCVFGAGAGLRTHGYSALVRGHSSVTIEGNAKVMQSVYGGGEMATVGRYQVTNNIAEYNISGGKSTVSIGGYAEIGPDNMKMDNGVDEQGKPLPPDDYGHVFGAGKGIQPYEGFEDAEQPWSKIPNVYDEETGNLVTDRTKYTKFKDLSDDDKLPKAYATYIRTLALTTETDVTIKDHAFVKGCVFGGSENGFVQEDTHVTIQDDCQIGNGYVQMTDDGTYLDKLSSPLTPLAVNRRYTADEWSAGHLIMGTNDRQALKDLVSPNNTPTYYTSSLPECASWPYAQAANAADRYAPYDPNYGATGYDSKGGRTTADDGHTFYGSVFGGGSGYYPYKPGRWFVDAGAVYGNARVDITGGHILTSVYGGNEMTNVGKYQLDNDGKPTTKITSGGKCTITMSGGTVGVPRTLKQIGAHPVTCYLFGAGKGDQRVLFNKSTNVGDVEVNITGGTIYGSVFGGGEDGHVLRDVKMTIENTTVAVPAVGESPATTTTITPTIGTWGTSYVDGNVFGGGRGFAGDSYTAGNVAGSIQMEIKGGNILGSIYGGGRLGSVGYGLYDALTDGNPTPGYGEVRDDDKLDDGTDGASFFTKGRGHIDITISGGTIGNDLEYIIPNATNMAAADIPVDDRDISKWDDENEYWTKWKEYHKIPKTEFDTTTGRLTHTKGGNVFAGGMGNFYKQDGKTYINDVNWWQLGCAKSTKLTITGGTIKSNVYGGGELGQVVGYRTTDNVNLSTEITIQGSNTTIGTEVDDGSTVQYTFGSVFGGGYGSLMESITVNGNTSYPKHIAGLVKEDTKIDMQNGAVKASVYGGGEMASVGESTGTTTAKGSTYVIVSGGTVGIAPTGSGNNIRYFGGAKMGNVYGGGSGDGNTVRSGKIFKNTNVTISGNDTRIYHNVYGGGAYGTVGDFNYTEDQTDNNKVIGVNSLKASGTGVARVTITGGTIGYDGKENGMVFGSSRGDINVSGARDDHTAWVYDTHVTIGIAGTPASGTVEGGDYVPATSATGPAIKGSVYGSGENGHTFHNTVVTVNGGTIGIDDSTDRGYTVTSDGTEYSGAAYPYRGNVYGGGCGTDKYYPGTIPEGHTYNDGEGDYYNALAGIVYGTTTVTINDGHVVRNVYGAGAMGSVGKTTWTTTTTTENDVTTTTKTAATTTGGLTTININGGIIGVNGTDGDGNVFGAARGSKDVVQADRDDLSKVRETSVTVSAGEVKGNVYGGGELGDVGTIVKNTTNYNFTWVKEDNSGANVSGNNVPSSSSHDTSKNTGICNVTITGGTIGSLTSGTTTAGTGNVFGGGKGDANTWWCEKATAFATNVNIIEASGATTRVRGSVYGGGEIGRVEDDAKVIIGTADGSDTPEINGNVFGAGKGLATRGYSALVRGNSVVTIQGSAQVGGNVFGGGEEASLGRFNLVGGLPKTPQSGGYSTVTIQDNANIGSSGTSNHVYGAGQGVTPNYVGDYKNFKSMQLEGNKPSGDEGDTWDYYVDDDNKTDENFVWVYYKTEEEYLEFLKTLALASHPTVTIAENATVYGDVYGGGQRGLTLGNVAVNITGGTVKQDVYGGGSLADTNKGNWDDDRYVVATVEAGASVAGLYTEGTDGKGNTIYIPTVANATNDGSTTYYRKGAWTADKYDSDTYATTFKTNVALTGGEIDNNVYGGGLGQLAKDAVGTQGQNGYEPAKSAVKAKVYGDVLVKLNEPTTPGDDTTCGNCVVEGKIFGCNNLNGSPQSAVTVHVYKTQGWTGHDVTSRKADAKAAAASGSTVPRAGDVYELKAVYGGGDLSAYAPDLKSAADTAKTHVIIDGCYLTSIETVYGGGNAASAPATEVTVNGAYEIGQVFGGGNGLDDITVNDETKANPGANVGYMDYSEYDNAGNVRDKSDATTPADRYNNYHYGSGIAHAIIYGGTVHAVYGGSNTKGNVRVESIAELDGETKPSCDLDVEEAYGGGRNADQDGKSTLIMKCIKKMGTVYGGAENADVNDIELNITNGTYDRVFGGNNKGGCVNGKIVVNIEETGCRPIIIGELYGGGNMAGYSIYGYKKVEETVTETETVIDETTGESSEVTTTKIVEVWKPRTSATDGVAPAGTPYASPIINVRSFTSIGDIYGGGYGESAVMAGDPTVNINVVKSDRATGGDGDDTEVSTEGSITITDEDDNGHTTTHTVNYPTHEKGKIGAINKVFGGGNAAKVVGSTNVNIGTTESEYLTVSISAGTPLGSGSYSEIYTKTGNTYTHVTSGTAASGTTYYKKYSVVGADIRGNVYGGGNAAEVTGDTNVVIGKEATTTSGGSGGSGGN